MKKITFTILTLAIAIFINLPSIAQANLITNPGFETGGLTNWSQWTPGAIVADVVTGGSEGDYCAKLYFDYGSGDDGVLYQKPAIAEGQSYTFEADIMSADICDAAAYLKILFHENDGYSPIGETYYSSKLTSPNEWISFSVTAVAPVGANYAEFGLALDGMGIGTGSAQFDNCNAGPTMPVPEPNTFMLLGVGIMGLLGAARRRR